MKNVTIIFLLFSIDQLTKFLVTNSIPLNSSYSVSTFFNIVFIYNKGFLFGYLSNLHEGLLFVMYLGFFFLSILIIYNYIFLDIKNRAISLLFFAGVFGNSFDRFFKVGVVDFIDLHYYGAHWPAFNMADSFIFIGVIIYIFRNIFGEDIVHRNS